jgi:hypothetical protein
MKMGNPFKLVAPFGFCMRWLMAVCVIVSFLYIYDGLNSCGSIFTCSLKPLVGAFLFCSFCIHILYQSAKLYYIEKFNRGIK